MDNDKLSLEVGDRLRLRNDVLPHGDVEPGEIVVVLIAPAHPGGSFAAMKSNGARVDGCSALRFYWTPVSSLPVEAGATVQLTEDYLGRARGSTAVIEGLAPPGSFSEPAAYLKPDSIKSTTHVCYVRRFTVIASPTHTPVPAAQRRTRLKRLKRDGRLYRGSPSAAIRRVGTIVRLAKDYSVREIAAKLGLSKSAVHRVIQRAA